MRNRRFELLMLVKIFVKILLEISHYRLRYLQACFQHCNSLSDMLLKWEGADGWHIGVDNLLELRWRKAWRSCNNFKVQISSLLSSSLSLSRLSPTAGQIVCFQRSVRKLWGRKPKMRQLEAGRVLNDARNTTHAPGRCQRSLICRDSII